MAAGIDPPAPTAAKRPAAVVRAQRADAAPKPTAAPPPPRHAPPPPRVSGGQLLRVGILVAAAFLLRAPLTFDPAQAGAPKADEILRAR